MNKALLLVVDVQKGFVQSAEIRAIIPRINHLIERWSTQQWPIVYSRYINLENSNWERLRDWHEMKMEPATELADDLTVVQPYIFKKSTYAAWSNEVAAVCFSHHVQDVVIVGVDTNECVLATALAVFDSGLVPWVVQDCCASNGGAKTHRAALDLLGPLLGKQQIISSDDVR
jgi:nicotinamidase-related amidase